MDSLLEAFLDTGIDTITGVAFIAVGIINLLSGLKNQFSKDPKARANATLDLILCPVFLITGLIDLSHNTLFQVLYSVVAIICTIGFLPMMKKLKLNNNQQ